MRASISVITVNYEAFGSVRLQLLLKNSAPSVQMNPGSEVKVRGAIRQN